MYLCIYTYKYMYICLYTYKYCVLYMVYNIYTLHMCVCIYMHTMFYSAIRILHAKSAFNENIKSMTLARRGICLQVENLPG